MIISNPCYDALFQNLPPIGEEFSITLSGNEFCLDKSVNGIDVLLYTCHFSVNQRWIHNTETLQVISVQAPSLCWDIDGKLKYLVVVIWIFRAH